MAANRFIARLKPWMLPIAMVVGILTHNFIGYLSFLAPWLIFIMLFTTFCKINPREIRVTSLSAMLVAFQLGVSMLLYYLFSGIDLVLAQGLFICVFCPTATAAPVITGMLGGSIPRLATFSVVSNLAVAVTAPMFFPLVNEGASGPGFAESLGMIASKIGPLVIAPLILALLARRFTPRVHSFFAGHQSFSFYIWAVSLTLVVGTSVSFAMREPASLIPEMLMLAGAAGVVCLLQFYVGRKIGRRCGDKIVGAQGLGQKNTVLAIWMALSWLDPLASIAPAAYIAWQNTLNSLQLYYHAKVKVC